MPKSAWRAKLALRMASYFSILHGEQRPHCAWRAHSRLCMARTRQIVHFAHMLDCDWRAHTRWFKRTHSVKCIVPIRVNEPAYNTFDHLRKVITLIFWDKFLSISRYLALQEEPFTSRNTLRKAYFSVSFAANKLYFFTTIAYIDLSEPPDHTRTPHSRIARYINISCLRQTD